MESEILWSLCYWICCIVKGIRVFLLLFGGAFPTRSRLVKAGAILSFDFSGVDDVLAPEFDGVLVSSIFFGFLNDLRVTDRDPE